MGMSASQARYLGLIARQNDLEYQGQQINQERTVLSQQVTDLYNTLQNMNVPTPPSTSDFTKVVYSGIDGANKFTLGNIIPTGDTYSVDFNYQKIGHYLAEAGSVTITPVYDKIGLLSLGKGEAADGAFPVTTIIPERAAETYSGAKNIGDDNKSTVNDNEWIMHNVGKDYSGASKCYALKDGQFIEINEDNKAEYSNQDKYILTQAKNKKVTNEDGSESTVPDGYDVTKDYYFPQSNGGKPVAGKTVTQPEVKGITRSSIINSGLYVMTEGGKPEKISNKNFDNYFTGNDTEGYHAISTVTILKPDSSPNAAQYDNPDAKTGAYYAAGNVVMTLQQAKDLEYIGEDSYNNYIESIKDTFPDLKESEINEAVMVYFEKGTNGGQQVPHFVLTESLNGMTDVTNSKQAVCYDYTANGTYNQAQTVEGCKLTFDTSGRITKIEVPNYDKDNTLKGYKTLNLEAATETDENAYKDAYNKYEYSKYLYDKEQQEINAKTEVIQQEDKKLELKLQRLDNERTQITTEIEAVEKVINDNIESSYKTFSG